MIRNMLDTPRTNLSLRLHGFIIPAALFLLPTPSPAVTGASPEAALVFPRAGEYMRFEVYWTGLLVGKIDISNHGLSAKGNQPCGVLEGYARTTGAVEKLYSAKLKYRGYLRPDQSPWLYEEWENEDGWKLTEWLEFQPSQSLVRRFKKNRLRNELQIPSGTYDPVSAVYHLLTLHIEPGTQHQLNVTVGKDIYLAAARVAPGPVLETIFGNVATLEVTPSIFWQGKPLGERAFKAWFTADGRQIPLQLAADVEYGSFSANLVRYLPPRPDAATPH
jgi:hypothetical protein